VVAALVPVAGVFSLDRVFYIRDLALFFWQRHLWLRHSLLRGEWPLWDPYIGGGQSAAADALHQMFFLPLLLLRLAGTDRVTFNLWVALPFPLAALGTYRLLRRRFSGPAAALGAIVFSVSGPVISTGNFPNMSWCVALLPWMLWAIDRLAAAPDGRRLAVAALVFSCQVLAGEPVTMAATAVLAIGYAVIAAPPETAGWRRRATLGGFAIGAVLLGVLVGAVQLVPLQAAVRAGMRSTGVLSAWSLHPLGLLETISPHLFGDYFQAAQLDAVPWIPPLNSGREPFFFSIYLGPAVLGIALFGAAAGSRWWSRFWVLAGVLGLLAAFGPYTPFYPFLQEIVPLLKSFRFPVKYLIVSTMAVAALAAAGWDALGPLARKVPDVGAPGPGGESRFPPAAAVAIAATALLGVAAYVAQAATIYFPQQTAFRLYDLATFVEAPQSIDAAAFLLHAIPPATTRLIALSLGTALLIGIACSNRRQAWMARVALYATVSADLVTAGLGINPTFDARRFDQPAWTRIAAAHPESRFHFAAKAGGIELDDPEGPKGLPRPPGLSAAESRAVFSFETAQSPGAWRAAEMISYDLAILWPLRYRLAFARFRLATPEERARFLSRTGVRYRLVPSEVAAGRPVFGPLPYFLNHYMYDWNPAATRAVIAADAAVVPEQDERIASLFAADADPLRRLALTAPPPPPAGRPGAPARPAAQILREGANRVVVQAATGPEGGYLLLLDSYDPGWQVTVDGSAAPVLQANELFRAVHLTPGEHVVEFRYRPAPFFLGLALTGAGLAAVLGLWFVPLRLRSNS
jgi:hypothetical protein